jgi:hypothetical protein
MWAYNERALAGKVANVVVSGKWLFRLRQVDIADVCYGCDIRYTEACSTSPCFYSMVYTRMSRSEARLCRTL